MENNLVKFYINCEEILMNVKVSSKFPKNLDKVRIPWTSSGKY